MQAIDNQSVSYNNNVSDEKGHDPSDRQLPPRFRLFQELEADIAKYDQEVRGILDTATLDEEKPELMQKLVKNRS